MKFPRPSFRNFLIFAPCLAAPPAAHGAVIYTAPVDIVIPFNYGGVYLDLVSGDENGSALGSSSTADSFTIGFSEPGTGNWDLNLFFGGAGIAHNETFQPYRAASNDNLSAIHNVLEGSLIDGGPVTPDPASGVSSALGIPDFGGSGTGTGGGLDGSLAATHMGAAANQFESGTPRRDHDEAVAAVNKIIREIAAGNKLPLVDFHAACLRMRPGKTWDGTIISKDGVHPSGGKTNVYDQGNLEDCGYALRNWVNFLAYRQLYFEAFAAK